MTSNYADNRNCYSYVVTGESESELPKNKSNSLSKLMIYNITCVLNNPLSRSKAEVSFEEVEEFIRWANKRKYHLNWRIFAYFLSFRYENKKPLTDKMINDLLIFSASQWTYFDKSDKEEIIIYSKIKEGYKFIAKKSKKASVARKLYIVKIDIMNDGSHDERKEIIYI
ncbi:hypothetical protein [Photorhabdus sp. CRCIA-P01]|uniref:hypothetical protein n=1 Tax=Photorhabdus sp. CRCIA-P01 TaxID=2019570 RepID=UPI000E5A0BEA|nr:hypothetical protein [Photorhabdus sp. CRCIA-P01]